MSQANLFMMPVQDIRVGGRQANASYQFTLLADELSALRDWEPAIRKALGELPQLTDVNSDKEDKGAEMAITYDRDLMAQLGIDVREANSLLNNAFGQRQVSTIYEAMNQYKVVMEVALNIRKMSVPSTKCLLSIKMAMLSCCLILLVGSRRMRH